MRSSLYNVININDMSLNEMIDNILLIARNSNITESEHLSRVQIEKWIISYRAMLIKQDIDKGRDVNELYITTIEPIHLDILETSPGKFVYVGDKELPKLIDFNYRPGVIAVRDMYGNLIQLGNYTKAKLQKFRKATCKDYIAWVKNNKIYVEGDSNQIEYISVDVIAEDPTELKACFNPNDDFPIPGAMIPIITQMIIDRELRVQLAMPSDTTNDTQDNTQNRYSK